MKSTLLTFLFAAAMPFCSQAVTINFASEIATGTTSQGDPWPVDGSFQFEVGVFSIGFTPDATNVSNWETNWHLANDGAATGIAEWIDDDGDNQFVGSGQYDTNTGPWAIGSSLYLWGYNSRGVGTHEWLLLANPDTWETVDATSFVPQSIETGDSDVTALLGSINVGGTVMQSAEVTIVPEPSTIGLLGLGLYLFAWGWRRRR